MQPLGDSMKKLLAVLALILMISTFAVADIYVKSKNHTDPISVMGTDQPATDTVSEQWIGDGKVAIISPANTMILDLNQKVINIVNHKAKTYVSAPLPLDLASLLPSQLAGALASIKMAAVVTPTGNKKTYGTRSCDEYSVALTVSMMPLTIKVYASTDVPFDYKNYVEKVQISMIKSQLIGIDDASIKELGKIQGFWIATETNADLMGAKIHQSTEVIEMTSKPAPAEIYTVPAGYTKQDSLSLQDLQGQTAR
jgi:hypothetical protein